MALLTLTRNPVNLSFGASDTVLWDMAKKGIQLNQELARQDRPYDATRRQSVAWAETLAMEQNAILLYSGGTGRDFAAPPDSHVQMSKTKSFAEGSQEGEICFQRYQDKELATKRLFHCHHGRMSHQAAQTFAQYHCAATPT